MGGVAPLQDEEETCVSLAEHVLLQTQWTQCAETRQGLHTHTHMSWVRSDRVSAPTSSCSSSKCAEAKLEGAWSFLTANDSRHRITFCSHSTYQQTQRGNVHTGV